MSLLWLGAACTCSHHSQTLHSHSLLPLQVSCLPNFQRDLASRVFIDVMNEPDSMNIKWEPDSNKPGAHQLYLGTADALWQLTPDAVLFFFEGTGQNMFGLNWGNGFITNQDIISSRGLSDPNAFFQDLLRKPYVNNVSYWRSYRVTRAVLVHVLVAQALCLQY